LQPYLHGIQLFNNASFFEAHEVLEDVWRVASEPERKFLQALIQLAVAFHHRSQGNLVGARSLLARAARNLEGYPGNFGGIHLTPLMQSIGHWQRALEGSISAPPLPQLVMRRRSAGTSPTG
jgi:predicted metal-dependent hydrolase